MKDLEPQDEEIAQNNATWLAEQDLPAEGQILPRHVAKKFGNAVDHAVSLIHVIENDGSLKLTDAPY